MGRIQHIKTDDFINLPASSISRSGSENDGLQESGCEPSEVDSLPVNSKVHTLWCHFKDYANGAVRPLVR